jgi:hypothetical protein
LDGKNKYSNFHNFFLEAQNNPYTFLNLRHLYLFLQCNDNYNYSYFAMATELKT